MTLTFYAPTLAEVASGEALSEGVAKLMVVFNNGSSAIASLMVSTNPATVQFTAEGLYVEVGYGTTYLVGGMVGKKAFETNFATILDVANKHLAGTTSSQIYDMSFMEETSQILEQHMSLSCNVIFY